MADKDTRFIVVAFYEGIGHTMQGNDELAVFFHSYAKTYKKAGNAINKARQIYWRFHCLDSVYVFKVKLGERLSCDQYKAWKLDDSRWVWDSRNEEALNK
jgi:hypothetical protein